MRQLSLKKKESRLLWQILMRGILVTDRMNRKAPGADHEAYTQLRPRIIAAWKSGLILGGIRPKSKIHDIMPRQLLQQTELATLKKLSRKDRVRAKRNIIVPRKRNAVGGEEETRQT